MIFKQTIQAQQSIYDLCAYLLTLILLIMCAVFLHTIVPADIPVTDSIKKLFVNPGGLLPETKESTLFVTLIVLLLPLNYVAIRSVTLLHAMRTYLLTSNLLQKIIVLTVPVLLIALISWDELVILITGGISTYWLPALLTALLGVIVFLSALTLRPTPPQPEHPLTRWLKPSLIFISLAAILISVLSFRLQSISLVNEEGKWWTSFEAVLYSVSQVTAGKTLLADLPAQYGLYAEMLKPIFSLVRLSVFSFTVVMDILQIISLLAVLWFSWRLIKNNVLRLFTISSICLMIGGTWMIRMRVTGVHYEVDEYYQYWPLRFMFPALSLCAFYVLLKREQSYTIIGLMALFSGVAITWNLDSGIPVFGAFIAYLFLQLVFPIQNSRLLALKKILLTLAVVFIWLICFYLYLQFKAEQTIQWQELIKYQQIFYQAGFYMLPMPITFHPWLAVIGVYIFAITGALSRRLQKKHSPAWDMLFFMAILGLGLFAYYQGRSHILVLTGVLWPAMLIAFILTDRTLRAIRVKLLPPVFISTLLPVVLLGLMLTAVFINTLPILLSVARHNSQIILQANNTPVTENIAFIRHYTQNSKKAVIISQYQAVYFAETGLMSAVNGPGSGETILVSDLEQFFYSLSTKPVAHLFVQQEHLDQIYLLLQDNYKIKAKSNYGMIYLVPKD